MAYIYTSSYLQLLLNTRKILSFSHGDIYDGWLYGVALKITDHECRITCFEMQKSSVLHWHRINVQILNYDQGDVKNKSNISNQTKAQKLPLNYRK